MLSESFYLKLAVTCKNLFPFVPVVRLVIFNLKTDILNTMNLTNRRKKYLRFSFFNQITAAMLPQLFPQACGEL